jgi:hypothetical protein
MNASLETNPSERALVAAVATWLSGNFDLPSLPDYPHLAWTRSEQGYDPKTINVPDGWTGRTQAELSILVNRTAHYLQNLAGRNYACPQEREALPYAAQDRWLRLSGRNLSNEFSINPEVLLMSTQCVP